MPEDVKDIEKRREERRTNADKAKAEQYAKDIAAIDAIEADNDESLTTLPVNEWKARAALPTLVGVRAPTADQYKRFGQQVRRAGDKDAEARAKAQELLAQSCWAYPTDDATRKSMVEEYPGVLLGIAIKASQLAEISLDEGKG